MKQLFSILLMVHITGGSVGLLSGTVNMIRKKGDRVHRRIGKIFSYGMFAAGISALALSVMNPNYFLFIVGIFTLYMVATGERYLINKKLQPEWIDWALTVVMLVFGVGFIGFGTWHIVSGHTFGIVFLVFGLISLNYVRLDWRNYQGKSKFKNQGITEHIQRMCGVYIAATTAFVVVNISFQPSFVLWLLPSVVVTPLIVRWTRAWAIPK